MIEPQDVARKLFRGDTDSFVGLAVRFWQKCDPTNRLMFAVGFPEIAAVCEEWYTAPNASDFFAKYGVGYDSSNS